MNRADADRAASLEASKASNQAERARAYSLANKEARDAI